MEKVTLVTIVCKKDLFMLETQIKSIVKYADWRAIKEHIIIFNEADDMRGFINNIVQSCSYSVPTNIVDGQALLSKENRALRGWFTQQVMKLQASKLVNTRIYFVLDAKNHLVDQYHFKTLLSDSKPIIYTQSSRGGWQSAIEGACDVFSVREETLHQYSAPITPFPMITEVVNQMHGELEMMGKSAEEIICQKKSTEFLLYWVYLTAKKLTSIYEPVNFRFCPHQTLFRSFDFSSFEELLLTGSPEGWVGIHLKHFSSENKHKILAYWNKYNIAPDLCGYDNGTIPTILKARSYTILIVSIMLLFVSVFFLLFE